MATDTGFTTDLLPPLNALANPHRLDLLHLLRDPGTHFPAQPAGPVAEIGVCVTDLQAKLKLSQSTTSQYLALLERSGMVAAQRIGQWTYWKLKEDRIRAWLSRLESALTHPGGPRSSPAAPAVKVQDILAARLRIQPHVRCTPLEPSPGLSRLTGAEVRIKFEHLQHTGSSASRAAINWLRLMREQKPGAGVVVTAAGSREIGLAYAGQRLGVPVCAFLADAAGPQAVEQFAIYGAEVRPQADFRSVEQAAITFARDQGWLMPPAGTHPAVLSGLGTIAVELFEEFAGLDAVVVPADDASLFLALNHALKTIDPGVKVFGIRSRPVENTPPAAPVLPSGVAPDRAVTVSVEELRSAAAWMLTEHRMALPPAGTAAIGYLLSTSDELRGRHVAALIPGGEC
jgi:threonine dehydratase